METTQTQITKHNIKIFISKDELIEILKNKFNLSDSGDCFIMYNNNNFDGIMLSDQIVVKNVKTDTNNN